MEATQEQTELAAANRVVESNGAHPKRQTELLLRTKAPIIVTLAKKEMKAQKLLDLHLGAIIEFDHRYESPVQISVNNLPIGLGQTVKVGDHFGVRVTSIVSQQDRVTRLGGKWRY